MYYWLNWNVQKRIKITLFNKLNRVILAYCIHHCIPFIYAYERWHFNYTQKWYIKGNVMKTKYINDSKFFKRIPYNRENQQWTDRNTSFILKTVKWNVILWSSNSDVKLNPKAQKCNTSKIIWAQKSPDVIFHINIIRNEVQKC